MPKVYTFVTRIETNNGPVYAHVGPDQAYASNAKATTAKRDAEMEYDQDLTNWSFTLQDTSSVPAIGAKVYVVFRKVMVGDRRVLLNPDGEVGRAWLNKKGAQAWRKANGGRDSGLVIFSFTVDAPGTPVEQEYEVTVTLGVRARSITEAEHLGRRWAAALVNGNAVSAGVAVR